ncbi:MAG TPA: FUSC family protein [Candidatus Limnocylindrales bacterium]|jgi:uncharacterized membrane protein YgaE (UPF0421/DUF939 family)|nr:FUSC family protein [Candidatus Limnocylindrales bacterium]
MSLPHTGKLAWIRADGKIWPVLVHSARTAVAAIVSVAAARLLRLPETYWAPVTTLVIVQSSLGAALAVSRQRFAGTALGAAVAAVAATYFGSHLFVFGISVFLTGLLCALVRLDRSAYRFAGMTVAIVLLIPRPEPTWQIAYHRFAEVSVGIAVALLLATLWPEKEDATATN